MLKQIIFAKVLFVLQQIYLIALWSTKIYSTVTAILIKYLSIFASELKYRVSNVTTNICEEGSL